MTKVIYYTTALKECPPMDFIESLSTSQARKVSRVLTYIQQYGLVTAIRHIKKSPKIPPKELKTALDRLEDWENRTCT